MKHCIAWLTTLLFALALNGCGGGQSETAGLPAPSELTATGSLGHITLTWAAPPDSTRTPHFGYHVYRRVGDSMPVRLTTTPIIVTTYDDTIASPEGDGVLYTYTVTTVTTHDRESVPSAPVTSMHGTRVPGDLPTGFTAEVANSPYVVEGIVSITNGGFTIPTGSQCYLLEGAVIFLPSAQPSPSTVGWLTVRGLLRVLGSPEYPATIGCEQYPGFVLAFENAVDYNPADNSGTLIQNCRIEHPLGVGYDNVMPITGCRPKFANSYISGFSTNASGLCIRFTTGVIVDHCAFNFLAPAVYDDLHGTGFSFTNNIVRPADDVAIRFRGFLRRPLDAGAITGNDFGGRQIDIVSDRGFNMVDQQLSGNYWREGTGTPPMPIIDDSRTGGDCTIDLTPVLSTPPPAAGPSWEERM